MISQLPIADGGYGFNPAKFGILASIAGLIALFMNIVIVPIIIRRFGAVASFRIASIIYLPTVIVYPLLTKLAPFNDQTGMFILFISLLLLLSMWRILAMNTLFTGIFILINNSVRPENRGKLNGFGQSLVSTTRAIGIVVTNTHKIMVLIIEFRSHFGKQFIFMVSHK